MLGIGSFFERFRSREMEEIAFASAVASAVKESLNYDIDPALFSYSHGIISLKISPAAKAAVMLKKIELLKRIQEKTKRKVTDIR
jgi:hypothetical protein